MSLCKLTSSNDRLIRRIDELTEELGAIHREGFLGKLARLFNLK